MLRVLNVSVFGYRDLDPCIDCLERTSLVALQLTGGNASGELEAALADRGPLQRDRDSVGLSGRVGVWDPVQRERSFRIVDRLIEVTCMAGRFGKAAGVTRRRPST